MKDNDKDDYEWYFHRDNGDNGGCDNDDCDNGGCDNGGCDKDGCDININDNYYNGQYHCGFNDDKVNNEADVNADNNCTYDTVTYFLVTSRLVGGVSVLSSSFIEEEHQLEHFFLVTVLFLTLSIKLRKAVIGWGMNRKGQTVKNSTTKDNISYNYEYKKCYKNQCIHRDNYEDSYLSGSKKTLKEKFLDGCSLDGVVGKRKSKVVLEVLWLVLTLVLLKTAKCWNQTGDKWKHLEDVGDWLNR